MGWLHSYVMLVRLNMIMELSNVSKKKKKKTIECDKNTVICDIGIAQELSNMTIELSNMTKQIRVPPNVTKV